MLEQTLSPDLTVTGKSGYCLEMQENVWRAEHWYDFAEEAWEASSEHNHPDEQPPDCVAVPVYWTYYDRKDDMEYGHVATWVPGRGVYSSTFNTALGAEWYPSIQAMTDRINQIPRANSRYLGWSEVIANIRVVQPQGGAMTQSQAEKVVTHLYLLGTRDYPTPGQADYWVPRVRDVDTGVDELGKELFKAQQPGEYVPYAGEQLFVKKNKEKS